MILFSRVKNKLWNRLQNQSLPRLQTGAGGVGGLVAVSVDGDFFFPGYDNNGNVIGYWDEESSIVAEYAYDAFGNTISSTGSMVDFFPHRFSTKYYDSETDLYYYGYRYYSPSLGRWISRDPIGEEDSLNLFAFCQNNVVCQNDPFGLYRYITDFSLIDWDHEPYLFWSRWHVGVSVDTWEKKRSRVPPHCYRWSWTGVKTFDFQMDYTSIQGWVGLITTFGKAHIKERDGELTWSPRRIVSTPEQDIVMLKKIQLDKAIPSYYRLFRNNCIHWAWNAVTYGMGAPLDKEIGTPRIGKDSIFDTIPLVEEDPLSIFR